MELQQIVVYTVIKIPSEMELSKRPFLKLCVLSKNIIWKRLVTVINLRVMPRLKKEAIPFFLDN